MATNTVTWGITASPSSSKSRVLRSASRQNTVVPSARPTACWSVRLPSHPRSERGENCELASCTATSIIDSRRVTEVIRPAAMAENTERPLGTVVSRMSGRSWSDNWRSIQSMIKPTTMAPATYIIGTNESRCRI
jgi:hypothetical protein